MPTESEILKHKLAMDAARSEFAALWARQNMEDILPLYRGRIKSMCWAFFLAAKGLKS